MTGEKKSDGEQEASNGIDLSRLTRRSYLTLTAAIGGLIGTGGVDAASSIIENFEQYDGTTTLDDVYSASTGAFDVVTDTVFEGDQSLYSASSSGVFINSTSGLSTYPTIGDTIEWYTWSRSNAGDRLHFLPQSETNRDNHYSIDHSLRDDRMRIGVYVDGSSEYFAVDSNFTTTRDERWLRHRLETEDTGSAHAFTYKIYEYNPAGDDTLLNSISGTDAEASISDGREFSTGGIGWLVYGGSGTERWFDGLATVDDAGDGEEGTVSVTTAGATEVGGSSATLNGSLDDLGSAESVDVYFEWGPSGTLSNATAPQTLSATGTFSEELTGLDSTTEYEYRAVAEASDGDTDTGAVLSFVTGSDGQASSLISPYYNLAPDPTSQSLIYWIDERTDADGGEQTFAFGTDPDNPDQQYTATGTAVPEKNGIYRYGVDISNLSAGTTYYGDIVEDGTTLDSVQWSTLPAELPAGGLDICVYSDIHIDNSDGMGDPTDMVPVRNEDPDLILFGGDYITWGDGTTNNRSDEEVVDWWLDLFREWYGTLHENRLHPVLPIPGNHEVGNHSWDGTGSVNPSQGVFQFFYGYPKNLDPVGENYGEVTIGNYLQLLSLDTHSAYPEDVGNWLAGAIDGNVLCTIPFHHSPLLTGGNRRVPEDDDLQTSLRDEWLRLLWDDESVLCHFAGHIHLREYTVPYEVLDAEPTSGEYIALDNGADGYLVADTDTDANHMMQFGTGYRANRSYNDEWFIDYIAEQNQFYSLTLTTAELVVRELDETGTLYESHTFSTGRDSGGDGESPAVTTAGATEVGVSSATLNGNLDDLGGADSATVYFEWGPSGTLSNATAPQTLSATGSFSEELTGLSSGTEYEYRAVVEASDGDSDTGSIVTFTTDTADTTVLVTTDSATEVGESSAMLNGTLDDLGGASSADVSFEYRQNGTSSWSATAVQTLSSTGSFSESVGGLSSGTEYEYRAVAEASDGDTDTGAPVTFTTDAGSTVPGIDRFELANTSNPAWARVEVDWAVSDSGGDLDAVESVLALNGVEKSSETTSVSGSSASGTHELRERRRTSQTYDVTLTVTDTDNNSTSRTKQIEL